MTPLDNPHITSGILITTALLGLAAGFCAAHILHHARAALRRHRLNKWPRTHRTVLFRP